MNAIDFIENDVRRATRGKVFRLALGAGIFAVPVLLGIGLRNGLEGVFNPRIFFPNLLASALLFSVPLFYERRSTKKNLGWILLGLIVSLFLATERVFFPVFERTSYASNSEFWYESAKCFYKGGMTTLASGALFILLAFGVSSWPSRSWRILLSIAAGISGAVMLGFHCDSSSAAHVLAGHLGPGILFGLILFGIQEILFISGLKRALPQDIKSPYKLG